jgi:hypothetical protein
MADEIEKKPANTKWAVMGGIALNVEYMRKYGFEASAAARVTAKLVALPAPAAFRDALQADAVGRQKRSAAANSGTGDGKPREPERPKKPTGAAIASIVPLATADEEGLLLLVPQAAGVAYTLDDGIAPPTLGRVSDDGVLVHAISEGSKGAVVKFANQPQPLLLAFEPERDDELDEYEDDKIVRELVRAAAFEPEVAERGEQADEEVYDDEVYDEMLDGEVLDDGETDDEELDAFGEFSEFGSEDLSDYLTQTLPETGKVDFRPMDEEEAAEEIAASVAEDDAPVLALFVPEKANMRYTIQDGEGESTGVVDADGFLIQPISPGVTTASLQFEDGTEAIQLSFAAE